MRLSRYCRFFLIATVFFCLSPHGAEGKNAKKIPFQLQQRADAPPLSPPVLAGQVEMALLQASNQERAKKKLGVLQKDERLVNAARDHSRDMLRRRYLSHFSPEGKSVVDRVKKYQPQLRRSLGENLHTITSSQGLTDVQAIAAQMMEDWMRSPTHRKNVLSKNYRFLGVGCASTRETVFCTQVFGG